MRVKSLLIFRFDIRFAAHAKTPAMSFTPMPTPVLSISGLSINNFLT